MQIKTTSIGLHLPKRAGLDYWDKLDVSYYGSFDEFLDKNPGAQLYFFTAKGSACYADIEYPDNAYLVFGKESVGLPDKLLARYPESAARIPMLPTLRCHNLSDSVAIAVYELLRQSGFSGMTMQR